MKIVLLIVCLAVGGIVEEIIGARLGRANGGTPISIEDAPYFVSLRRNQRQVCGGSFISTEHVLTAAHCVVDQSFAPLYNTRVVSGVDKYNMEDVGYKIRIISAHEGFLEGNSSCDIAVITLSMPVEWNRKRNRIPLSDAGPQGSEYATFTAFQLCVAKISEPGLLEFKVHLIRKTFSNTDDSDQVFYGTLGKHNQVANGDLGGALVYDGRIIGVAFERPKKHRKGCYFINVVRFKTFIERCLNSERPSVISWAPKRPRL